MLNKIRLNAGLVVSIQIEFSKAENGDLPGLAVLVNTAYRGETGKQGWTTESDLIDGQRVDPGMLQDAIEKPDSRILLARRRIRPNLLAAFKSKNKAMPVTSPC